MWLIKTTTLQLEECVDSQDHRYAILSHTWEDQEVSFQDMQGFGWGVKWKKGYAKIANSCRQALEDGHKYIWIDTCCIDQKSSAELSEAINSMFRWYRNAEICYTYLADVSSPKSPHDSLSKDEKVKSEFAQSRWFERGWTLQELIAPNSLNFYSKDWKLLGLRNELNEQVRLITGIDVNEVQTLGIQSFSIAQRMSWAAGRQTTKVEDKAYCLLGIFGIYMPLLYGEGTNAFLRLQEQILSTSDDHSLFAWTGVATSTRDMLATSASDFKRASGIIEEPRFKTHPYSMTHQGLRITLPCVPAKITGEEDSVIGILNCRDIKQPEKLVGIYLRPLSTSKERDAYVRIFSNSYCFLAHEEHLVVWKEFIIPTDPDRWLAKDNHSGWRAKSHDTNLDPISYTDDDTYTFYPPPHPPARWDIEGRQAKSHDTNLYEYTIPDGFSYYPSPSASLADRGSPSPTAASNRDEVQYPGRNLIRGVWEIVKDIARHG